MGIWAQAPLWKRDASLRRGSTRPFEVDAADVGVDLPCQLIPFTPECCLLSFFGCEANLSLLEICLSLQGLKQMHGWCPHIRSSTEETNHFGGRVRLCFLDPTAEPF